MNRQEFMQYIQDNFNVSGEALRLTDNILHYIEAQGVSEDEQHLMACALLDDTIGLTEWEIKKLRL